VALIGLGVGSASAARAAAVKGGSPVAYLVHAQNSNGGFGSAPGQSSDSLDSGWAALALYAGTSVGDDQLQGARALAKDETYLAATVRTEQGAGDIERTALAAELLPVERKGLELTDFGGRNLVAALKRLLRRDGSVADQTNLTAFWILAARPAGLRISQRTLSWLAHQQDRDGGFNWDARGGQSDIDDTGAVLQALAGSDEDSTIKRAVKYVGEHQNRDGGFGMQPGAPSNAQSTAFAVCGQIASFVIPEGLTRDGSPTGAAYLRSLIQPDGAVDYARANSQSPVWVTAEAEIALSGHTL
jgi:hypothetical protein